MPDLDKLLLEGGGFDLTYSRLKEVVYQDGLACQARLIAAAYSSGFRVDPFGGPQLGDCKHLDAGVVSPQGTFLRHATQGGEFPHVWIYIRPTRTEPKQDGAITISTKGTTHLDFVSISLQFLRYHETYKRHIGAAFRFAWDKIPEVWRFAAVIRNAIAHRGTLSIDNPKFKGVEWRGLRYDHTSNGRPLEDDLSPCDLLVLMLDMDITLMDYEQGPMPPVPPEEVYVQVPEVLIRKPSTGR